MESLSKTKLTNDQLDIVIKAAFGKDTVIVNSRELTDGWFNTGYDLELGGGMSVILKVAPSNEVETLSCEKNIMRTEVEALALMANLGTIPVPEVYGYDYSHALIDFEYFLMEKIDGQPYNQVKDSLSSEERNDIENELGEYSRLINEVRGERFGYFNPKQQPDVVTWRENFRQMIVDLLADGRRLGAQMPAPYETIEEEILQRLFILDKVTDPCLVHWDLWNGNLFVKDGKISAIIDWERALWGDPLLEYYFRHFENSEAFFQGYGSRCDSPKERERRLLYDLYLDLILVIECYSRKYENEDHTRWVHEHLAEGWDRFVDG
ncbi:aminoglycoside phosphotransferase (APT) family kinase protein [Paenibacillus sp. DS2015]|uniref:phosphotransferase family protein n=1 Tax=Paenibacillus sp. DS2015 TaxID=3373917 RepID=UPI003D22681B